MLSLICVLAIDLPDHAVAVDRRRRTRPGPTRRGEPWPCVSSSALVATGGRGDFAVPVGARPPDVQDAGPAAALDRRAPRPPRPASPPATLLIAVVSAAVLVAVVRAGAFAGHDLLPRLIATVVVFALPVSAGMAFWLAFRDGSPECDALERSSRYLLKRLQRARRGSEDCSGSRRPAVEARALPGRPGAAGWRNSTSSPPSRRARSTSLFSAPAATCSQWLKPTDGDAHCEESLTSEAAGGSRRHDRVHAREKVLRGLVPALVDAADPAGRPAGLVRAGSDVGRGGGRRRRRRRDHGVGHRPRTRGTSAATSAKRKELTAGCAGAASVSPPERTSSESAYSPFSWPPRCSSALGSCWNSGWPPGWCG